MFNLINKDWLENKENAYKAQTALNQINKVCEKYADKSTGNYPYLSDDEKDDVMNKTIVLSAYLLYLTAKSGKKVSFKDLIEKKVFVDLDFRRQCKINYVKLNWKNSENINEKIKEIENEDDDFSEQSCEKTIKPDLKYTDYFDPYISADKCFQKGVMLSNYTKEYLNEKIWNHLMPLLKVFPAEIFKEVVLGATDSDVINFCEVIVNILNILDIKNDDNVLFDDAENSCLPMVAYTENKKAHYCSKNYDLITLIRTSLLPDNTETWAWNRWKENIYNCNFSESVKTEFDKIWLLNAHGKKSNKFKFYYSDNFWEHNEIDDSAFEIDWNDHTISEVAEKFGIDTFALIGADNRIVSDWCNILNNIESIKNAKKTVCLVFNAALYEKAYAPFRKVLIENGLIESIYAGRKYSIMVFSEKNTSIDFCKVYDDRISCNFCFDEISTTPFENLIILANDSNLYIDSYLGEDDYLRNAVTLGSVISKSFRGVAFSKKKLQTVCSAFETKKRFLSYSDIKNGIISKDMLSLLKIDEKQEKYCAKNGDLIISKIAPLKIAVVDNYAGQILVGENLYVIRLKNKVEPYYVKAFLESTKGKKQIEKLLEDKKSPALSIQDIRNLKIVLPEWANQKFFVDHRYKMMLMDIEYLQSVLAKKFDELSHLIEE